MKTGFHAMPYGRSEETKKHSSMKLHATNQSFNFLGANFSNRDNIRAPIQFRREILPQYLQKPFLFRLEPSIRTSITLEHLDK